MSRVWLYICRAMQTRMCGEILFICVSSIRLPSKESAIMNLIHVTTKKHKCSIKRHGLLAMTETPRGEYRLYAVERTILKWACDHIMARHKCKLSDLVICVIPTHEHSRWMRYNRGVWYTFSDCRPVAYYTAEQYSARHPEIGFAFEEKPGTIIK